MIRVLFLALILGAFTTIYSQEQETEDLQFLIIEAISNNPEIAAQVSRMAVFEHKVTQRWALDDPELILRWMEMPGFRFSEAMYANIELMQMVRFPTKLFMERSIAQIQAEHAHHEHLEKVLDVVARLKSAYAMLWYARTALQLNRENQSFLRQILDAATAQYSVGKASQQDVLKTSIELAKLRAEEETLKQDVVSTESMLRAILNRDSRKPIGPISGLPLPAVSYNVEELVSFALTARPMVVHDSLSVNESALMLGLQKQEYLPDLRLGLEYVTMPLLGEKRWSVTAGITLPIAPWSLSKASARVQEASAERSMRESMFLATRRMIEAQVRQNYATFKGYESRVKAYESTILPQTDQSLRTLLTEYQTGRTSFLMLLDSFRMFQMAKMEAAMALAQYHQSLAALERSVGVTTLSAVPKENEQ